MRAFKPLLAIVSVGTFLLLSVAPAEALVAVAAPDKQYVTKTIVAPVGGPVVLANADVQPHNVIAFRKYLSKKAKRPWCAYYPKGNCPIFWSETIGNGQVTQVQGLDNVKSGTDYTFFCSIHPAMKGTLVVP
ncbi:MAG TPA: plastocyanin/azurin family copper-binding protein [Actinomycetota bacterium]|jgi:plastocyanin|nr:plastocyanin/azurin family copper-binding protein [Actinomycetota bacterium]